MREGGALLQGLATCGHCGRRLRTHYSGRNSAPGYHCSGEHLVNGRGSYCLNIGGVQIDEAVTVEVPEYETAEFCPGAVGHLGPEGTVAAPQEHGDAACSGDDEVGATVPVEVTPRDVPPTGEGYRGLEGAIAVPKKAK